jgi:hypothetical protein
MIRKIVTPSQPYITLKLPDAFVGKQIEIIAFDVEDTTASVNDNPIHLLSENVLAKDWLTQQEEDAWQDL